jgi:hypothetical protein
MMGGLGSSGAPGADTVANAISLLAAVSDPGSARAVLDQVARLLQKADERRAAAEQAEAANADRLKDLMAAAATQQAREKLLEAAQADLAQRQTQNDVAAGALAEREAKISVRETAADEREKMVAAREQALDGRIAHFRASLA